MLTNASQALHCVVLQLNFGITRVITLPLCYSDQAYE
jgi:hypothetical protein